MTNIPDRIQVGFQFPVIPNAKLYLAGGCVRDTLLGLPVKDRDFVIVTDKSFDDICNQINSLPDSQVYLAKPEFMTIRCRIGGQNIDLTWPRTESGYEDGRHPSYVTVAFGLKEDALRRDFTVNAMYLDAEGNLLDFFDGYNDLLDRVLRCPQPDPEQTFKDDYLRIFRLIRFSVTKHFTADEKTYLAAAKGCKYLDAVPFERIRDELNRALQYDAPATFLWLFYFNLFGILKSKGLTFQLTAKEF